MSSLIKLHLITPITTPGLRNFADVREVAGPFLRITDDIIDSGPPSVECAVDEALAVPGMLKQAIEVEKKGVDGILIDCMGDPGLDALREVMTIPVFGPCEISMRAAAETGKFSVVTVLNSVKPMFEKNARVYDVKDKLASIRVVNIPVIEIEKRFQEVQQLLAEQAVKAVEQDSAEVVILGCTGFLGCAQAIEKELAAKGHGAVRVIDPVPFAVIAAAKTIREDLAQGEKDYDVPHGKDYKGYDFMTSHLA